MTPRELIEELEAIILAHPEAETAEIWATTDTHNYTFHVKVLGWSKRRKPARIILEE